jgi:membrane-associated phospholipid phosphatase
MDARRTGCDNGGPTGRLDRLSWRDRALIALSLVVLCWLVIDPLVLGAVRRLDPATRGFFRAITDLGKSDWILLTSGLAGLLFVWLRQRERGRRLRAAWGLTGQTAGFVFLTTACAGIAGSLIKNIIGRARPKFFETLGPLDFRPFAFEADHAGFPSGHATTIFALAAALAMLWPGARVPLLVAGAWIAASRALIGAHYAADVLAGMALGCAVAWLARDRLAARRWLFQPGAGGPRLRAPRLRAWFGRWLRGTFPAPY